MNWQPIDSAPVDVPVLVFVPKLVSTNATNYTWPAFMTTAITKYPGPYGWELCEPGLGAEDKDIFPYPTHWMPLPEAPK